MPIATRQVVNLQNLRVRMRPTVEVGGPLFGHSSDKTVWTALQFDQVFEISTSRSMPLVYGELRITANQDVLGTARLTSYNVDGQEFIDQAGNGHAISDFSPFAENSSRKLWRCPKPGDINVFIRLSIATPPAADEPITVELVEPMRSNELKVFQDMLDVARQALTRAVRKGAAMVKKRPKKKSVWSRFKGGLKKAASSIFRRLPFVRGTDADEAQLGRLLGQLEEFEPEFENALGELVDEASAEQTADLLGAALEVFPDEMADAVGTYWDALAENNKIGQYADPDQYIELPSSDELAGVVMAGLREAA